MSTQDEVNMSQHDKVQQLLPWFINGQLEAAQQGMVTEHLAQCAVCRADSGWERQLRQAVPAEPAGLDAERALARLMDYLPPQEAPAGARAAPGSASASFPQRLSNWLFGNGWMPWALAGQTALIAGLAFQAMAPDAPSDYRLLSNGEAPPEGNVVVVFRADAKLGEVQRLMQASGARIVDGPTVTGAYVLDVPAARQEQTIAELKGAAGVELAEGLTGRGRP